MVEGSIDVDVGVRAAYDQWTRVEELARVVDGLTAVRITEQRLDERIAWVGVDGGGPAGVVTFERLGEARTRVRLELDVEPAGGIEQGLRRFKERVEHVSPAPEAGLDLTGMVDDTPPPDGPRTTETWD